MCHEASAFVTLTYSDDQLVRTLGDFPTLCPEHPQAFLKRLRARVAPARFRFYLVGEYGDQTHRPHYHLVLFGFPTCERRRTYRTGISLSPGGSTVVIGVALLVTLGVLVMLTLVK